MPPAARGPGPGPKPLVIVESPAKAKTIAGLLGPDYVVESSIGHIRDLPRGADEVPAAYKGEAWAGLGVDVDNGFKPLYVVSAEKKSQVAKLKQLVKQASEVYLASDEDREGESIAWHLLEVLGLPRCRSSGWSSTRSPGRPSSGPSSSGGTSTGGWSTPRRPAGSSTASTATRCPRSCGRRSCPGCRPAGSRAWPPGWWSSASGPGWPSARPDWWGIDATFTAEGDGRPAAEGTPRSFTASLVAVDGVALASGRDFDETGALTAPGSVVVLDEDEARALAAGLDGRALHRQVDDPQAVPALARRPRS